MLDDAVREAVAPLEQGYAEILELLVEALADDDRIRALWLGGSVGRGVADAGSDLDLVVTVTDVAELSDPSSWDVLDPIITLPIPGMPGCFAFTTHDGLRVDVVLERSDEVARSSYTHRVRVFDRDGLRPPSPSDESGTPDVAKMQALVSEFLRQSAIFPAAVVAREDWLLGQVSVQHYLRMLYELLVESNQPLPVMGVKQWSSRLTADQQDLLRTLPAPVAQRESVVVAMQTVREALRTHGRAALESAGGTWPTEVDDAMAAYWVRHGLAVS